MKKNAKSCSDHRDFGQRAIPVLVCEHARRQQTQHTRRRRRRRRWRVDLPRADRARLGADDDGGAVRGHARQPPRQAPVLTSVLISVLISERRMVTAATVIVRGVDRAQRVARASYVEHAQTPVAAAGQQVQRMRRLVR